MSFSLVLFFCLICGCLIVPHVERRWRPAKTSQTTTPVAVLETIARKLNLHRLTIQSAAGEQVHFVNNQVAERINSMVCAA